MAKKKVIDLDTYGALDAWAISLHEMYRALIRAGFRSDIAMGLIVDKDIYPDWILPSLPNRIDNIPYEDEDDD
jgi:hypothetical protein